MKQETQTWMTEFKGVLADLDKATAETRAQAAALQAPGNPRGAIEVEVAGLSKLDKETWYLQLGNAASQTTYVGAVTAAVTDLVPGPIKVRIAGVVNAKPWSVEKAAVVEAGKTTPVKVSA